jgi:hypothetical protein
MPNQIFPEHSCFNQLQVKYKGRERENTDNELLTTIVYQGERSICEQAFEEISTNSKDPEYGNIESVRLFQDEGPIWNIEIKYSIEKHGNGISNSSGSSYGPKSSVLSVRMMTQDLEARPNYRKHWNNNLYCTLKGQSTPDWWDDATYENDRVTGTGREYPGDGVTKPDKQAYWAWASNYSELPPLLYGFTWHRVKSMTKPRSAI